MAKEYCSRFPIDKFKRAVKYTLYWRKIERKFRLRRMLKKSSFTLDFKHVPFGDLVFDDEFRIQGIAEYYGYRVTDESLSTNKSSYTFVRM